MKIEDGKQVKLEYTLSVEGVGVIESSDSRGPLEYVHGGNSLPLGLEGELSGLQEGQEREGSFEVEIPTVAMKKSDFPKDFDFQVGAQFTAKKQGEDIQFTVESVAGEEVTVRPVHPLAGKKISYKVKVLQVSEPA